MAFEVTKLVHGEESAKLAQKTADEIFSGKGNSENMNIFDNTSCNIITPPDNYITYR